MELHRTRNVGFNVNALSVESIYHWLDLHMVEDLELRLEYYELITALDYEWMEWNSSKLESKEGREKYGSTSASNKRIKS